MKVTQICIGRFHHFHLARQLAKHGLLERIYTGYPRFQLTDEDGISPQQIQTYPWIQTPYMGLNRFNLLKWNWLRREVEWLAHETLDKYVSRTLKQPMIVIALSGGGLHSGVKAKALGGVFICDRSSTHILYQDEILREEYESLGLKYKRIDQRKIQKEIEEYDNADIIFVPSDFVRSTFLHKGIDERKIVKIPFGSRTDRFFKDGSTPKDKFRVLWVGQISPRKGFLYALDAFLKLHTRNKEFVVIGSVYTEMEKLISKRDLKCIKFLGQLSNRSLRSYYSSSHCMVLSSIEEGLPNVIGEALACGCPVIATPNTGADELIEDGQEGFIINPRSSDAILEKLELLIRNPQLQKTMSHNALDKVKSISGWDKYGEKAVEIIRNLQY